MTPTRRAVASAAILALLAPAVLVAPRRGEAGPARLVTQTLQAPADAPSVTVAPRDSVSVRLFAWPVDRDTPITDGFGARIAPTSGASTFHHGLDLSKGVHGQPIYAVAAGVVIDSGDLGSAGYGSYLTLAHDIAGETFETTYGHMLRGSKTVQLGERVSVGQVIGLIGSTGVSTGPHLHFEVQVDSQPIDPVPWLTARVRS